LTTINDINAYLEQNLISNKSKERKTKFTSNTPLLDYSSVANVSDLAATAIEKGTDLSDINSKVTLCKPETKQENELYLIQSFAMKLHCQRCHNIWLYKGKSRTYTICSKCKTSVHTVRNRIR
jgi:hypothetical protein